MSKFVLMGISLVILLRVGQVFAALDIPLAKDREPPALLSATGFYRGNVGFVRSVVTEQILRDVGGVNQLES